MEIDRNISRSIERVNETLGQLDADAVISCQEGLDKSEAGEPILSIVLTTSDGGEYAIYASGANVGINTYLRGMCHSLNLIIGNFTFKPINVTARYRTRASILPEKSDQPGPGDLFSIPVMTRKIRARVKEAHEAFTSRPEPIPISEVPKPKAAVSPRYAYQRRKFKE